MGDLEISTANSATAKKMMPRLAASGRLNNLNIFTYLHMSPGLTGTPVLNTTSKEQMPSRENFRGTGELSGRMESVADDMLLGYGHNRSLFAKEDMYMRYVYIYICIHYTYMYYK